jgi:hypothetical protein
MFKGSGEVARWHRAAVRRVKAQIQRRAPVDTGRLRSSWRIKHIPSSGPVAVSYVYTDVNYANYVIRGHGVITPKRGEYLRFRGRGGAWVFAKRVRAVPPNNFVQAGLIAGTWGTHRVKLRVPM